MNTCSPILCDVFPVLRYRDPEAALRFLCAAFGFVEHQIHRDASGAIAHAVLLAGRTPLMFGGAGVEPPPYPAPPLGSQNVYVVVGDPDAHHDRAKAAGATIVRPLEDMEYGSREYSARDAEGNAWHFGTYRPGA
jgi:uncharacterized glyoxalase superfamily protein PhnB